MNVSEQKLTTTKLSPTDEQKRRGIERGMRELGNKAGEIKSLADLQRAKDLFTKFERVVTSPTAEVKFDEIKDALPSAERLSLPVGNVLKFDLLDEVKNKFVFPERARRVMFHAMRGDKYSFKPEKQPKIAELVIFDVADLQLEEITFANIFAKAEQLGLKKCPPDTGPLYRLVCDDQTPHEYVIIGMDPVFQVNTTFVFCLLKRTLDVSPVSENSIDVKTLKVVFSLV